MLIAIQSAAAHVWGAILLCDGADRPSSTKHALSQQALVMALLPLTHAFSADIVPQLPTFTSRRASHITHIAILLCLQVPQLIPQIAAKLCSSQSLPLIMSLITVMAQLVLLDAKTVVDILAASQLAGVCHPYALQLPAPASLTVQSDLETTTAFVLDRKVAWRSGREVQQLPGI